MRDVDAVTDDVWVTVNIAQQFNRPQINTNANRKCALRTDVDIFLRGVFRQAKICISALQKITHVHAYKERVFRISQKTHRSTIPGIEDDALIGRNIFERIGEERSESVLEHELLRDRCFRIGNDIDKYNTADKSAISLIEDIAHCVWLDPVGLTERVLRMNSEAQLF